MKIFLTTKKGAITYISLFMLAVCMIFAGGNEYVDVNGAPKEKKIPIYCTDRGDEKICALTFDAAWDDSDTDRLISVLEKYKAKATFFVVGEWAEKYSESVRKFSEAGHEIANHSDTHPHINNLTEQKIEEEIEKCGEKIERITKIKPVLFRGPYGEYNNTVIETAEKLGYKTLQWDVDSLDWKELTAEEIAERVLSKVKPGSVMLFHNGVKNTPDALDKILKKLTDDGYKVVKASDMIYKENYTIDHTGKQVKN